MQIHQIGEFPHQNGEIHHFGESRMLHDGPRIDTEPTVMSACSETLSFVIKVV